MDYKIFGCKVNKYYVNQWKKYLEYNGVDGVLLGSCEVTDKAKNKWLKYLIRLCDDGKNVYLTGCGAFDKGNSISKEKLYSLYPKLLDYDEQFTLLTEKPPKIDDKNLFEIDKNIYTRKFIVIQNGCDGSCSFCLTTIKRGKHTFKSINNIVDEINAFYNSGGKEINLTGVNMAARGASSSNRADESRFAYLLNQILEKTNIPRIRLSSLGPEFLNDNFFEVIQNSRVLPHFHISVQSFSDKILKKMNRNYGLDILESVFDKFNELRDQNPTLSLGADILVGFPGESEEDLAQTVEYIQKYKINKVHAFPFSNHNKRGPKVPASSMANQLYYHDIKDRVSKIMEKAQNVKQNFEEDIKGNKINMLLEYKKGDKWYGWTDNYIRKSISSVGNNYKKGDIIEILL